MSDHPNEGFFTVGKLLFAAVLTVVLLILLSALRYSLTSQRVPSTRVLAHAKQIHTALAEYAIDCDGTFPVSDDYSNTAFRELFDAKYQDERLYFVPGSAWHRSLPEGRTRPDNIVGEPPRYKKGLERGENHYAYVSGLNNGSKGNLPIVADGFSDRIGVYSKDENEKGGVWEGEAVVIVRVDGSATFEKPDEEDLRVYTKRNGRKIDLFSPEFFGEAQVKILNPH